MILTTLSSDCLNADIHMDHIYSEFMSLVHGSMPKNADNKSQMSLILYH